MNQLNQFKRISKNLLVFQIILVLSAIFIALLSQGIAHPGPANSEPNVVKIIYTLSTIILLIGGTLAFLSKDRAIFYMHLTIGFLPLMLFISLIIFGSSFL